MACVNEAVPSLSDTLVPPMVLGTADLTHFAYGGHAYDDLIARIDRFGTSRAGWLYDAAVAALLGFRRAEGLALMEAALADSQVLRIADAAARRLPAHDEPMSRVTGAPPAAPSSDDDPAAASLTPGEASGGKASGGKALGGEASGLAHPRPSNPAAPDERIGLLGHSASSGLWNRRAPLRLLALVTPGDLMANTPLDFLTNHLNIRLDLLYVLPHRPLPAVIPDHDLAFFASGETDPATIARLSALYAAWPRPALNDPAGLPALQRDLLSRLLAGVPGICSPTAAAVSRDQLHAHLRLGRAVPGFTGTDSYPCLIRPLASHAGSGLARLASPEALAGYLQQADAANFFVTAFHDYRSSDGLYRKLRVALVDRVPFLCHLAVSEHWNVHYLSAGMSDSPAKRAEEAQAMATFHSGFARRHAGALGALQGKLGLDYFTIDCAETTDGRLLVFEADTAAIVHLMDPPEVFPYKPPAMRRLFAAFETMLRRRAAPVRAARELVT